MIKKIQYEEAKNIIKQYLEENEHKVICDKFQLKDWYCDRIDLCGIYDSELYEVYMDSIKDGAVHVITQFFYSNKKINIVDCSNSDNRALFANEIIIVGKIIEKVKKKIQ